MTTWENTDSINESENLTVTSDAAFERVTNDFKMEEENDWWFLKQNTAWLVQEIPNISFLDVADTMLESKKTFHKRENRVLRIGNAGKSVEAQPQDFCFLYGSSPSVDRTWEVRMIPINSSSIVPDNAWCFIVVSDSTWTYVEIKQSWYYSMKYNGTIHSNTVTQDANNTLAHGFDIYPDLTIYALQISSSWYRYYESISNEAIHYFDEWDRVWVYIERNWTWQIQSMTFQLNYLFNTI